MSASAGPKNSTNFPTTPCFRSIWVTRSTRSVAVAPSGRLPGEVEADDLRQQHVDRLAEHHGLGFDPADAPADHAEPVDHRGVAVGSDQRVRIEHAVLVPDDLGEILQVDLVDDADGGRHDPEVVECLTDPTCRNS